MMFSFGVFVQHRHIQTDDDDGSNIYLFRRMWLQIDEEIEFVLTSSAFEISIRRR